MPNSEYWGVPDGTYQSLHQNGTSYYDLSAPFFIPDVAGTLTVVVDLSDLHGFDGWPAGGTGGTYYLRLTGSAGSQYFPLSGGAPPSGRLASSTHTGPFLYTEEIVDAGVLALLKGETWRWQWTNGDNRESWEMTSTQIEIYPTALGPYAPPGTPGDIDVDVFDPTGVIIAGIDDAYDKSIQVDYNGVGTGHFSLSRLSPHATSAILRGGNLIKIRIPRIDETEYIFAFFLESENVQLISTDEQGGEEWQITGSGALAYPQRAVWLATSFVIPWWVGVTPPSAGDIGQIEVAAGSHTTYNVSGGIVVSKGTVAGPFTAFYDSRRAYHFDPADGYPKSFTRILVHLSSGAHAGLYLHIFDSGYTDHYSTMAIGETIELTSISPDTPGAILYHIWQEAIAASRLVHPTPLWDADFTATLDSNGAPWTTTDALEGMTVYLGEDYLTTIRKLMGTGVLDVVMGPDMVMHAYNSPYGVDRTTATFAAGKVRFVKGVNIADVLKRELVQQPVPTWAEVLGAEDALAHVSLPGSSSFLPREISLRGDTNDVDALEALGIAELIRLAAQSDHTRFKVDADDDELVGKYLPGPLGTDHGKYWPGDIVTLHTGTADDDFDETDVLVTSVTIGEDEAGELDVTAELGAGVGPLAAAPREATAHGAGISGGFAVGGTSIPTPGDHDELVNRDIPDQHPASSVAFTPAGTVSSTNVQAAIAEVDGDVSGHTGDTVDAHDASAISVVDAGGYFASSDVEGALAELGAGGGGGTSPSDTSGWMPLTTVVAGAPELVWDAANTLVPTYGPF